MENKKLIILIVLGAGAVASMIYGVRAPSKKRPDSSLKPVRVIRGAEIQPAVPRALGPPAKRRAKSAKYVNWGRNPFVPKGTERDTGLVLYGIMWEERWPKAMINGNIVGIGNRIGKNKVVDIKRESVILNDGTKNIILKLRDRHEELYKSKK